MLSKLFPDLDINYSPWLPQDKNARYLDYGCGDGRVVGFLKEKGYSNILATDIDKSLTDEVGNKYKVETAYLSEFQQVVETNKGGFDVVFCKDVIYYLTLPDLHELLKTFKRLLKPNGVLVVEIFNGSIVTGPFVMHKDLGIIHTFTEHSLEQLLKEADYENISIRGNKFPIRGVKSLIFNFIQGLWRLHLRFIYFLERGIDPQNPKFLTRKIIGIAKAK